jgi:enterochelin esterase-like enzyme
MVFPCRIKLIHLATGGTAMHGSSVTRRTVVKHIVPSRILPEGSRTVRLFLPPGYQETLSFPVVYVQDGEQFFNFGRIATIAQQLILENDWEPFVVVGVDVDLKLRTSEYMPGGERHASYIRFWNEELLPEIESRFAVRRSPGERLLAGASLGASACLSAIAARPDLFTRVIALSGAYYDASRHPIAHLPDLSGLSVWMTVGLQETAFETDRGVFDFVALNRDMHRLLVSRGASVSYSERDGEHKWGFWQQLLPEALGAFLGPEATFR